VEFAKEITEPVIADTIRIIGDPKVVEYLPWKDINTKEKAIAWLKHRVEVRRTTLWVVEKETNTVIGKISIYSL
jgi:hypothetical protein